MLNTTKDYAKFKDGRREDRNDSHQNSSDNQQENTTHEYEEENEENSTNEYEEENEEVDEVSGGHTYTPLNREEILAAAMTEGEEHLFTPEAEDFAEEERAVGAMVVEYSDDDSKTNDMPALTKRCGSDYWSSSDDDSDTSEYWQLDDDEVSTEK